MASAPEAMLNAARDGDRLLIEAVGEWILPALERLERKRQVLVRDAGAGGGRARVVLDRLDALDTSGAWLLLRLERDLAERGFEVEFAGARRVHASLLSAVRDVDPRPVPRPAPIGTFTRLVAEVGKGTIDALDEARRLLSFFGQIMITLGRALVRPRRLRPVSLVHHLEQTGVNALPIVGLISFLIGIVLAYQGADQLRRFGAEIFTIDLLGISVVREIGILLTAIVVAGRSGSAFTAQIGTMQVNEEIDALRTLGLDPIEVLVLPRLLALLIALPLLAFFANIMALLGGGLMCAMILDIGPAQFIAQLSAAISPGLFLAGMIKAPVFALLIAMVGCYEGMRVSGSAESVGRRTTQSVVEGIFLVIVFDALFSVIFSYLGV